MFRTVIVVLTFLAIPAYCSVLIPPDEYYLAGMLTLTIPIFTIILIAAFIYFSDIRSRWVFLPASILCFAFSLFASSFSFIRQSANIADPLFILTHNMNALQYYQKPAAFDSNRTVFKTWVKKNNFDVLCLQEMIEVKKDSFLLSGYYRVSSSKDTKTGDNLGLFIFSRYPIIREGKIEFAFNSFNRLMWADIVKGNDTVRIVNIHLMSYDFYPNSIWKNIGKVKAGLRARSWHAKLISKFLSECKYPVILCGDLNETPVSYPYRKINRSLDDTFVGSGNGFEYTYRFFKLPIRIDHIFRSHTLRSTDYHAVKGATWSDHLPVSVRIGKPMPD